MANKVLQVDRNTSIITTAVGTGADGYGGDGGSATDATLSTAMDIVYDNLKNKLYILGM